jgi:hypothetical protein
MKPLIRYTFIRDSLARFSLAAALAATAFAAIATVAPPALAAAPHAHEGAPQASHQLALDHGRKWAPTSRCARA